MPVVVDLTVVGYVDGAGFVLNRLMAACDIDYAQPGVSQPNATLEVEPGIVWSTMVYDLDHAAQESLIVEAGESGYAARGYCLLSRFESWRWWALSNSWFRQPWHDYVAVGC